MAAFVGILVQQFARPQAADSNRIELEFFNDDSTGEVEVPGNDTAVTDSKEREKIYSEGKKCNESNHSCVVFETLEDIEMGVLQKGRGEMPQEGEEPSEMGADAGGVLGQTSRLITMTYTPQASGVYYVAEALNSTGLASPTYAQGYGYYALSPFLRIWRVFRNLVYMIFAIMIIVIAIMILFRQKVGSQAAVTAQQALPRIVVALILVTFSYAIAGFLIDLMYWLMAIIGAFVEVKAGRSWGVMGGKEFTTQMLMFGGFGDLASIILTGQFNNVYSGVQSIVAAFMGDKSLWESVLGHLAGATVSLIFMIALIFSLFRLLFILMKSYAAVLLYTLFSPFFLMMHAIPGTNSFSDWVKKIIANLSPSIIVFVMIIMIGVMNHYAKSTDSTGRGFVPPYITAGADSSTSGSTATSAGMVVSFAILLAMPEIVNGIKQKLAGGSGFFEQMAGSAGGRFMGAGGGMALGYMRRGAMGLGRGTLNQARGLATAGIVGGLDWNRRRREANRYLDETMGNNEDNEASVALAARDSRVLSLQNEMTNAETRADNLENNEEIKQELMSGFTESAKGMTKEQLQEALGANYDKRKSLSWNRDEYVKKQFENEKKKASEIAKQKRQQYEKAIADYNKEHNIDVENTAAVRQAVYDARMALGKGSFNHWRRTGAGQGFFAAAREAWGLTDWQTEFDANEQAYMQRRRLNARNAINERLNLGQVNLQQMANADMYMQMLTNAANNGS